MASSVGGGAHLSGGRSLPRCRSCSTELRYSVVDLGMSPLAESFVPADMLHEPEMFYPLQVYVCHDCFLVQLDEFVAPEHIFSEYAYFSSYAASWVEHAGRYARMAVDRFRLGPESLVIEVASNDGYLLRHFVTLGVPVLGIEPAANVARVAEENGVRTLVRFFSEQLAKDLVASGTRADLLVGNNVLAQVPNLNDFVAGLKTILKPDGVITLEFPSVQHLLDRLEFDTIYHEHFSYFSLGSVHAVARAHTLRLFDAEELTTHGGSLRVYLCHEAAGAPEPSAAVERILETEERAGLKRLEHYGGFQSRVEAARHRILSLLIELRGEGKRIAGYGAPGKGNTLLNYCGIRTDFLEYTVDRNPHKHGKFLPGTRIPIHPVERILETRPDYVFILPWNLKSEITSQMSGIREWGGKFIVPIPEATIEE